MRASNNKAEDSKGDARSLTRWARPDAFLAGVLMLLIRLYRWTISPVLTALAGPGGGCRFHPTCSQYAMEAIQQHGAIRGSLLALKRIGRCHPLGECGHDPVPEKPVARQT